MTQDEANQLQSQADDSNAYRVRCPLCRSYPSEPCYDPHGNKNELPHMARVDAYKRLVARSQ